MSNSESDQNQTIVDAPQASQDRDFLISDSPLDRISADIACGADPAGERQVADGLKVRDQDQYLGQLLAGLSHPDRLRIVTILIDQGALSVAQLVKKLNLRQPAVSQHLNRLRALDVIDSQRHGKSVICFVKDRRVVSLVHKIRDLF